MEDWNSQDRQSAPQQPRRLQLLIAALQALLADRHRQLARSNSDGLIDEYEAARTWLVELDLEAARKFPQWVQAGDASTSSGVALTDEVLDALAAEAERGYDPDRLVPRPVRDPVAGMTAAEMAAEGERAYAERDDPTAWEPVEVVIDHDFQYRPTRPGHVGRTRQCVRCLTWETAYSRERSCGAPPEPLDKD